MKMPTDFEIDDFGSDQPNNDIFNCDEFFRDNVDMDYVYDEELFQKITNEIEIPLFGSESILLRDATPNEIFCEATKFRLQEPTQSYNNLTNGNANNQTEKGNYSIDCCDTNSSNSPTPSLSGSDSGSINDNNMYNVISLETPPISPPRNSTNSTLNQQSNQPILINGDVYQMISFQTDENSDKVNYLNTNGNTIQNFISPTQQIKIPINTTTSKVKNVKRNVLFPKSASSSSDNNQNDVQLFTVSSPGDSTGLSSSIVPPLLMNNGGSEVDQKAFKRMQRMIKNRESACMSRKRKKDYVVSLEKRCEQLSIENKKLRMENNSLKQIVAGLQMNCKSSFLSFNNISSKNTAILLGMLLMVSINVGSFRNLLFKDIENEDLAQSMDIDLNEFHTRHLLNIPENPSGNILFNEDTIRKLNKPPAVNTSCPLSVNQTENIRLASELRKFIGDPLYNLTHVYQRRNLKSRLWDYEFKRNMRYANENKMKSKLNKLYSLSRRNRRSATTLRAEDMKIYSFGPNLDYTKFFDRINLKDDTFYVISLRGDHMLIPAMNHNKTSRPKMSLLMPAIHNQDKHKNESFSTPNNHITLVKIDCEVLNTNLVHVNQNSIPEHLRSSFQNQTQYSPTLNLSASTKMDNIRTENITITRKPRRKPYKPYFIKTDDDFDLRIKNFGLFP